MQWLTKKKSKKINKGNKRVTTAGTSFQPALQFQSFSAYLFQRRRMEEEVGGGGGGGAGQGGRLLFQSPSTTRRHFSDGIESLQHFPIGHFSFRVSFSVAATHSSEGSADLIQLAAEFTPSVVYFSGFYPPSTS